MPSLSARGACFAARSPLSEYMIVSREHADRRWTPNRQDGFIDMSTAENKLMWDLIGPVISAARDVPPRAIGYDDIRGNPTLRSAVARFASATFLGAPIEAADVCAMAGAGAVLEATFWALCEPGDGVLVPTPGYAGFWMDLENRDEVTIVPVPTDASTGFRLTVEALDQAWESTDRPIRALLLASPDNPTGRVLDAGELTDVIAWIRERGIHLVSDEIYALSVYGGDRFVSVSELTDLADDIHIVWAISKDFAASGLRCGFLFSKNAELKAAVSGQALWSAVSGQTQHFVSELLCDGPWIERYISEMRRRLATAYCTVGDALGDAEIPHLPASAGFFLIADLRRWLPSPTFEAERDLWRRIVDAGVNLTPGKAIRSPEPGLFRLCFTATPTESLPVAVDRIRRAVASG